MFLTKSLLFPPVAVWQQACISGQWTWEACENYQKKSNSNRYEILTSQGSVRLSIPLAKGKNNKKPIQEVEIAYSEDWIAQHLRSIRTAYGSAPYFEYYFDDVQRLLTKQHQFLWDLNMEAGQLVIDLLHLPIEIKATSSFQLSYDTTMDWRFLKNELKSTVSYVQLFEDNNGHFANPSILDVMFCCGPETVVVLQP